MNKIAILMRGPIRPNIESVLSKAILIKEEISKKTDSVDIFISTWKEDGIDYSSLISSPIINNIFILSKPSQEEVIKKIGFPNLKQGYPTYNAYLQYYMCRFALKTIKNYKNYDFIVHSRTDLSISFGEHIEKWFSPNIYKTIHISDRHLGGAGFTNDQFAIATTDNMIKAWDYETIDHLRVLMEYANIPENILEGIMAKNNVIAEQTPFNSWELDPNRHSVAA
ncbi:hypothetical protein [Zymomonas mobilis]|uniref:Uncharacterized protein n=1 Tax=Zymomonas mobilis subsp. pomaceae (strain ATCC 29192 / DSM 22645 / JCM 10191 / CCUG 17912 / NBRC 13757 / NCIMB 11200 / NRRL B-4491 / Barker I) TaxID=579138 RepID=F8ETD8_ZYMMT|nr:hypothetical protein [Zymomonas mobilis]AEI37963.1 hypothetical protein Zymop_1067 [Zymomonas mobilis subsp. pomaceae ATCC 29192]MDX5949331.1 hypothetical protein [Zymomonas mobilis subsp. pomaceae]GEB89662.1 hypothetical protein ZMO02_12990 [Zymomonas mobilis subsp. pomaceae]